MSAWRLAHHSIAALATFFYHHNSFCFDMNPNIFERCQNNPNNFENDFKYLRPRQFFNNSLRLGVALAPSARSKFSMMC